MKYHRAWVGLGSNLAEPRSQIELALEELDRLPLTRLSIASRLYASQPQGPRDQPDYINAVAGLETRLSPLALLDQLQALEQRHRRVRVRHWGPRTLDLDLLLFDQECRSVPRLTLPHPEMARRAFVLVPLAEVAPDLRLPNGDDVATLAEALRASGNLRVLPGR